MTDWSPADLLAVDAAQELEIAVPRADGTPGRWVPIWVVTIDDGVRVRTWFRRSTGWYGHAMAAGRARVRVPGLEADVRVLPVGTADRAAVDSAYRAKYGTAGGTPRMVADEAALTTLRIEPIG